MSTPIETYFACIPMHTTTKVSEETLYKKYYIVGFSRMLMPSMYDLKIRVNTSNEFYAERVLRKRLNIPKKVKL